MNREDLIARYGAPIKVLDKGHVRLIDLMGDDQAIVQAARVSYGKGYSEHKWKDARCEVCGAVGTDATAGAHCREGDRKLIRYLMEHLHTSPFEMNEIKLHCKMPLFVARQWIRHRTASVNEISGRYTILPNEYYMPDRDRIGGKGLANKQSTEGVVGDVTAQQFLLWLDATYEELRGRYEDADTAGISNEVARLNTGVGQYTEWYWKIDLHNLMHFLQLRMDDHAQWETRMYANAIALIVQTWCPFAWEAFVDYRQQAVTLSRMEAQCLRAMIQQWGHGSGAPSLDFMRLYMDEAGITAKSERGAFLKKLGVIAK